MKENQTCNDQAMMTPIPQLAVCETDAARALGVSVKLLRRLRLRGGGPRFVKISNLVRYQVSELERWMVKQAVESTTEFTERRR
jgi:hypothetical protein